MERHHKRSVKADRAQLRNASTPDSKMDLLREFLKSVGQAGFLIESRRAFPFEKSNVVLLGRVTHLLERLKSGESFVAPGACQLARDPGMRGLANSQELVRVLFRLNDHSIRDATRLTRKNHPL